MWWFFEQTSFDIRRKVVKEKVSNSNEVCESVCFDKRYLSRKLFW